MVQVLVIGSGGREHAIAYGLAQSKNVAQIYVAPGNAGTAGQDKTENIVLNDNEAAVQFCQDNAIDLVVIGPEAPLVAGLADMLRSAGIPAFGPSQVAAQLEGSKSFATAFMQKHDIAIPESRVVTSAQEAQEAIASFGGATKAVIKADGLAGGKGVFLPNTESESSVAIEKIISGKVDGDGSTFVIQRRESGPETSVFVLSDGDNFRIIPLASQDHKRLGAGDTGPNTGGMGVYAPLPDWMLGPAQWEKIEDIARKSIEGMQADGTPYQGVLYIGIMLAEERGGDPIVIEYNVRFGDPEAEVIIPLLEGNGVDIYELLAATAHGKLGTYTMPKALNAAALTICLAAAGYPDAPVTGEIIHGLSETYRDVIVFHGGTVLDGDHVTSSGGRVLYVTGMGTTLAAASQAANAAIGEGCLHFSGMQYRQDIGHRALSR